MIKRIAPILLLLALVPLQLFGQQTGASVTGVVLDPSGAAVSGATIKLTSTTTGAIYPTTSDSSGIYQLPFVLIGPYSLSVEKQGFKTYDQTGIILIGDQKAVIGVTLQLGAMTSTVNVTANATVLQAESGDRTATISNVRLDPEVLRGQNAIVTTWFTPGVTVTAGDQKIRPWDNAGTQGESFNGGQDGNGGNLTGPTSQNSGNQVMVDGISENRGGNGTGFNLMASAVQEVEVQSTMYDAENGWSTGGFVNTLSKSGTNQWHGHGYDYIQNTILNAEDWGSIESGTGRLPWHFNYFGGEIGGPLKKNKIFVFYAYQRLWSIQRDPFSDAVPTQAERQGNFQGLCSNSSGNCQQVQLYDPSTLTDQSISTSDPTGCYYTGTIANPVSSGTNPCRAQTGALFSGVNVINPTAINPIAKNILNIIPQPVLPGSTLPCGGVVSGQTGPTAGLCGTFQGNIVNNSSSRKFVDYFPEHTGRIDWNFNDRTHAFFRFSKNDLAETRSYVYSTTSSINAAETSGNNPLFRGNQAPALQVTHTFSPTTVLELRTGMDRYPNGGGDITVKATDAAALGFSSTWEGLTGHYFPQINITNDNGAAGTIPSYTASDVWNHEAVIAHTHNKHNLRFGWQRFDLADYNESPGNINGVFGFTGIFTSVNPTGPVGATGNATADFLLGYPNSGSINQPAYPEYWQHQESLFLADDYHISRKLTLNLGIRWDYAGPEHDKYNRLLNGFCFTCSSPLGTAGTYANSLGSTVAVGALLGGPTFAGAGGAPSGITNPKYDNFGPRIGFAYDIGHDMVVRGGWGIIYGQQLIEIGAAPGFSGSTSLVSQPNFPGVFNPNITFANPIQTGLLPIVGSAYGLATNMGAGISFIDPNIDIPRTQQFSFEVQKRVGSSWLFSAAYVGSKATRLNVNQPLNYIPLADMPYTPSFSSTSAYPTLNTSAPGGGGANTVSFLGSNVVNPFTVPTQYLTETKGTFLQNAKVSQTQLLYQYPEFGGVTEDDEPIGRSHYNSLQLEVNHRLAAGLEFNANFTWAKTLQAVGFLNPQDPFPRQMDSQNDFPRQFKLNFVYFAPLGPGQKFLNQSNPVISRLVSGWSLSATPMLEDGPPAPVPAGLMPLPGSEATQHKSLNHWFNTCYLSLPTTSAPNGVMTDCGSDSTPAWRQEQTDQLIEWSPTLHNVRYPGVHDLQLSLMKKTTVKERYLIILRCDMINALNSAQFFQDLNTSYTSGAFGFVGPPANTPSDDPRVIQMSLQLQF